MSSDAPPLFQSKTRLPDHDEDPRVASLIQRAALGATRAAEALQWPEDVLDLVSCNDCGWGEIWWSYPLGGWKWYCKWYVICIYVIYTLHMRLYSRSVRGLPVVNKSFIHIMYKAYWWQAVSIFKAWIWRQAAFTLNLMWWVWCMVHHAQWWICSCVMSRVWNVIKW